MRKQCILSLMMLLMFFGVSAQQKEYKGKILVTPLALAQRGDSVYLKIKFDVSGINVDSRRSISFIPVLVAPDRMLNLPEVMVKGRENYNVHQRELSLMSKRQRSEYSKTAPYAVLKGYNANRAKNVEYNMAIKYEPWMAEAKLDLYEDLCGCGGAPRRVGVSQLVNLVTLEKIKIVEVYSIVPYLAYVQPVAEAVKRREIAGEAFLDFVVSKIDIRPEYMNNPGELKKITDLIKEIDSDENIKIKAINVIGYASPEGTLAGNQRLSEGRAKALVEYLVSRFDFPRNTYNVKFGGENWDGLKQCVEASTMPYRRQVLDIIETVPADINLLTNTSRKKSLMLLQKGDVYRYMVREFYPSLRKAVCKIEFDVRNFDVEQAKTVVKTKPQNLSLNEMFLVANSYDKGSQDFIDLFETAVRLFPNDVTANLNAASSALVRKDLVSARRYLDIIEGKIQSPEYYNTLGTLAMLKGDYETAKIELNKAADSGLIEARQNLEELAKKLENMNEINEQKAKK